MGTGCQIDQNINLLWPILSALTGEPLAALPYDERLSRLLSHGFGGRLRARRQPRLRHPQACRQRLRPPAPVVPVAGNGRLQWTDFRQVRVAVCCPGRPHRGAALINFARTCLNVARGQAGSMALSHFLTLDMQLVCMGAAPDGRRHACYPTKTGVKVGLAAKSSLLRQVHQTTPDVGCFAH